MTDEDITKALCEIQDQQYQQRRQEALAAYRARGLPPADLEELLGGDSAREPTAISLQPAQPCYR